MIESGGSFYSIEVFYNYLVVSPGHPNSFVQNCLLQVKIETPSEAYNTQVREILQDLKYYDEYGSSTFVIV